MIKFNDNNNTVLSKKWIKTNVFAVQSRDRDIVFLSETMQIRLRLLYENTYNMTLDLKKIQL